MRAAAAEAAQGVVMPGSTSAVLVEACAGTLKPYGSLAVHSAVNEAV